MISGLYAHNHGMLTNNILLRDDIPSIAKIMDAAGYMTSWIGKSHMGGYIYRGDSSPHQFDGFAYHELQTTEEGYKWPVVEGGVGEDAPVGGFDQHWIGGWTHFQKWLADSGKCPEGVKPQNVGGHNDAPSGGDETHAYSKLGPDLHPAKFFSDKTIEFLKRAKAKGKPFLSVLSYYGPHHPVAPPKPYVDMYDLDDIELPANHKDSLEDKPVGQRTGGKFVRHQWTEEQLKDYIRRYYGYVSYLDDQLMRVLDTLKELDLDDNTIVVFTADHGDMMAHHGMIHKMTIHGYDQLLRVPLMIRWPNGIKPGQVTDSLVSNIDLMPTLVELAGLPAPEGIDGKSLGGIISGEEKKVRDQVFCDVLNRGYMVREGEWKFVLNANFLGKKSTRDLDELYNLTDDPWERHNLAMKPEQKKRVGAMQELIYGWLTETEHPYAAQIREKAETMKPPKCEGILPVLVKTYDRGEGRVTFDYGFRTVGPIRPMGKTTETVRIMKRQGKKKTLVWEKQQPTSSPVSGWGPPGNLITDTCTAELPTDIAQGNYVIEVGIREPGQASIRLATGHVTFLEVGELKITKSNGKITVGSRVYNWQ